MNGIAVIIPCRNQADTLARAIESAIKNGATEIVVFDDGNDDYTRDIVYGFMDYPSVVLTGHPHPFASGVGLARNISIIQSKCELILPLDADDELLPGAIEALLMAYRPGSAVYGNYVVNDAQVNNAPPEMIYRKSVCHATVLFSKADWQRVGGYKPEFNVGCEDWDFALSLVDAGVNLTHIDTPIYRKAINPNGRGAKCLERRPLIAALLKEFHSKVSIS